MEEAVKGLIKKYEAEREDCKRNTSGRYWEGVIEQLTDTITDLKNIRTACPLIQLSEISDEDAIEVAKILLGKADGVEDIAVERNEYYVKMVIKKEPDIIDPETTVEMCVMIWLNDTSNPVRWVWNYIKGIHTGIDDRACPNVIAIYDYLRRKGYALSAT